MGRSSQLIVIGGASLDILHFAGRTAHSAGGAGLYTSLAAHRAGSRVTMVGPRPRPVPPQLAEAVERLDWRGPEVAPQELPTFEIAHLGDGVTEMRNVYWRAESALSLATLPSDLPAAPVFVIPLADPRLQLDFVCHFAQQGLLTASGTFLHAVRDDIDAVHATLATVDIFFCNQSEAEGLFGALDAARTQPGKLLFITRGARGVRVVQGAHVTDIEGVPVRELDPTGAGDTFCGTTLSLLLQGEHPIRAAQRAVAAAAEMVTRVGPEALLLPPPPPSPPADPRVVIDDERVAALGGRLRHLERVSAFDFTGDPLPPIGDPAALDFFFAATLQQFGFWIEQEERYSHPMQASLGGRVLKGSDYLWSAYRRWCDAEPGALRPAAQAVLQAASFDRALADDEGHNPLPESQLHVEQARCYGHDLVSLGWDPVMIVERAAASEAPLASLFGMLDRIGGYKEDPLRKKSALLAAILQARPEGFLPDRGESLPPIIDYHLQRSCLRTGLVRIADTELHRSIRRRLRVDDATEWAIRETCFRAMIALSRASGQSMAALDWFFFQNRHRCPEMNEPDCAVCPIDAVCARDKELFQPVLRTVFY